MNRELRDLLRTATGQSSFVVALNVDIRGFSSFFADSSQAAAYLSSAYTRILDEYFPEHSFFKPTGDGLLIIRELDRENLKAVLARTVKSALSLDQEFKDICQKDDLINFPTPMRVGIGIAWGSATKIVAGDKVLDVSGFPLNLCSRLMDLARPHGVVFDKSLKPELLPKVLKDKFKSNDGVFVRGLAETEPMTIHITKDVIVPPGNRRPIGAERFIEESEHLTLKEIRERAPSFRHSLARVPIDEDSVELAYTYPVVTGNGRQHSRLQKSRTMSPSRVATEGPRTGASFNYKQIADELAVAGVKSTWVCSVTLSYLIPIQK